jgi:hypothetical protein
MVSASPAAAAPPYVDRGVVLPRHDWAFDFGLGIGHRYFDPNYAPTGVGLNIEGAVAVTRRIELGFRQGIRFGNDGQNVQADRYGRLFDRQTYGTYGDTFANPEFRIRGALIQGDVVELGLEGRATIPIETGSRFGSEFGMPVMFHIGRIVRLDTGIWVPVVFHDPARVYFSAPLDVWIQATNRFWIGPMTGLVYDNRNDVTDLSLGVGLGYSITHYLDFKAMFLFPGINHTEGGRNFGTGAGIQIRIE